MPHPPPIGRTVILVFLKAPLSGLVKTRLAADIGKNRATGIYKELVLSQLRRLPEDHALEIHYTPPDAGRRVSEWLGTEKDYFPQIEGNLGERIQNAVTSVFARGAREVLCIGADCPSLLPIHFEEASRQLSFKASDLVLGPSSDGGYYLIGLRKDHGGLFSGIRWSSAHTLEDTMINAERAKLKVHFLETLNDIDDLDDLRSAVASGHFPPCPKSI